MMSDLSVLVRDAGWFSSADENGDVAVSSRVRLSRNLADFIFPGLAESSGHHTADATAAAELISDTVRAELMPDIFNTESLEIQPQTLDPESATLLVERRLADHPLPQRLFVTADESAALSVGTVDHLRISALQPGIHVDEALKVARVVDTRLEENLNYAVSLDLGYLSTNIANLGTALRASVLVHVPALARLGRIDEVQDGIRESEFDLLPDDQFTANDGESAAFRLSNRRTLGFEEEALVTKLEDHAQALVHYERIAREELVATRSGEVADAAYRALGVLRHARRLGADETLTLLSVLRLGVVAGLVDGIAAERVTALFFLSRKSHVLGAMHRLGVRDEDGEEDVVSARARLIRAALAG